MARNCLESCGVICFNCIYFEDQNFQDKVEVVGGDECAVVEVEGFGENAPGASFVTAALVDFLTDLRIDLHFCFRSAAACQTSLPR